MLHQYQQYLSKEKKFSPHTIQAYVKDIQDFISFIRPYQDNFLKVTTRDIRKWLSKLSLKGYSEKTINRKIASLKSFYNFLLKTDTISQNPLQPINSLKVRKKIPVPFSPDEMNMLFDSNIFEDDFEGIRDRVLITILYSTGIRRSELINIKTSDIDLHNKQLKVLGKRNKERIVPLLSSVVDLIEAYIQIKNDFFKNKLNSGYLFVTQKGKKMYGMLVYRLINSYLSKVSVKHKKSPHMIRHTFATHLLNNGADLNAIKELLGHTSLAATQVYTHTSVQHLKEIYKKTHPRSKKNIIY